MLYVSKEMRCAVMLQTQISAIMEVLVKAAVAEISQLLEDDAAALHEEIQKRNEEIQKRNEEIQKRNEEIQMRNDEIQGLKALLVLTETKLQRLTADRCSVAVQVEMMDTSVTVYSQEPQADCYGQEKTSVSGPEENLSEEKPHIPRKEMTSSEKLREDEDLSGLEFEMKIEQVEELVDQKLNEIQAEPNREGQDHREHATDDRNSHLWPSGGHIETERQSQSFTDSYVSMEDQMSSGYFGSGVMLENESFGALGHKDIEYGLNLLTRQDLHGRSPTPSRSGQTNSDMFSRFPSSHSGTCLPKTFTHNVYVENHPRRNVRPKPFRCEECGKGFTQKTRLITHRRVHTGEKPFRCQLCGKTFSRQDNCLRHVRLHSGQRS